MALDKFITELDQLQTLKDSDLITIGRPTDGRLFQCTIIQLKTILSTTSGSGSNGKSAYELAVSNGYNGTLAQWLKSLEGKPGEGTIPIGDKGDVIIESATEFTNIYRPSFENASARTVNDKLDEIMSVEEYRAGTRTDTQTIFEACTAAYTLNRRLRISKNPTTVDGKYYITSQFTVPYAKTLVIDGHDAVIVNNISGYDFIEPNDPPPPLVLDFPTGDDPGPMRGCAFYFVGGYDESINGIKFEGFRFAIAQLTACNSSVHSNNTFERCNCGFIAYKGNQTTTLLNWKGSFSGCAAITSATAFTIDSPYKGEDDAYTDGFTIESLHYPKEMTANRNDSFDVFIRDSILRPTELSYSATNPQGTLYPYPIDSDYCLASDRLVFAPFPNLRGSFSLHLRKLDGRGGLGRGLVLCNTRVIDFAVEGVIGLENISTQLENPERGLFVVGSVASGKIQTATDIGADINLLYCTGRGYILGDAEYGNKMNFMKPWYTGLKQLDQKIRQSRDYVHFFVTNQTTDGLLLLRLLSKDKTTAFVNFWRSGKMIFNGVAGEINLGTYEVQRYGDPSAQQFGFSRVSDNSTQGIANNNALIGRQGIIYFDETIPQMSSLEGLEYLGMDKMYSKTADVTAVNLEPPGHSWSVVASGQNWQYGPKNALYIYKQGLGNSIVIDSNGNVGFFEYNPQERVDVNGNVKGIAWVFKSNGRAISTGSGLPEGVVYGLRGSKYLADGSGEWFTKIIDGGTTGWDIDNKYVVVNTYADLMAYPMPVKRKTAFEALVLSDEHQLVNNVPTANTLYKVWNDGQGNKIVQFIPSNTQ